MMHWLAKVDARDVEFVLAPLREEQQAVLENALGRHVVWILDFDCCRPITVSIEGAEQAATAFMWNDPYFPRPGPEDSSLWETFREAYLGDTARFIDDESEQRLPGKVIELVENRCRENAEQNDERSTRSIGTYDDEETQCKEGAEA
ncbi:MAG: hypothetical protein MMC23_004707 [Stictis urceolatum]|nr:hypothetical protein [Stictis urceolata]